MVAAFVTVFGINIIFVQNERVGLFHNFVIIIKYDTKRSNIEKIWNSSH